MLVQRMTESLVPIVIDAATNDGDGNGDDDTSPDSLDPVVIPDGEGDDGESNESEDEGGDIWGLVVD